MTRTSYFTPLLTIDERGIIDMDWGDSFQYEGDGSPDERPRYDETEPRLSETLDEIIGSANEYTLPQRLRRLADYIEGCEPSTVAKKTEAIVAKFSGRSIG